MIRAALRLWRDRAGAALAEFAIVMPFMILLLIGFAEGLQLVETHRRVARAASSIGDLAGQVRTLNDAEFADLFVAGAMLMYPLPTTTLGQRLTGFSADSTGKVTKDWSVNAPQAYAGSAPEALPAGYVLTPNQGVVIADVSYVYKPMVKWILPTDIALQKRMLLRPRAADRVTRN